MRLFLNIIIVLSALIAGQARAQGESRPAIPGLSEVEARHRAERLSQLHYQIDVRLDEASPEFSGSIVIDFVLSSAREPLTLDFSAGRVTGLTVNGQLQRPNYNDYFLTLAPSALVTGNNKVTVSYQHAYAKTSAGLYRFIDPEDGKAYLYTNFEPYHANEFMPCFDQPDLKASFSLNASVPADWTVISAVREDNVEPAGDRRRLWHFADSPQISTYLFSLDAGPYHSWTDQADGVPMRLFSRESVAKDVDAAAWFATTKHGLVFYREYFDQPYPFAKLDSLLVPNFNGGEENAAAIIYLENVIFPGPTTLSDTDARDGLILHELAHQWFGDLVTMRWWGDLWLKESFATYMAVVSAAANGRAAAQRDWLNFFRESKMNAYQADGLPTTHPVIGQAEDTVQASINFDAITYHKGAAVLRSLAFYLGEDLFRNGVRAYLRDHRFGSATQADFITALSQAAGTDLQPWSHQWLETSGANRLAATVECSGGKIASLGLNQEGLPLRPRRTLVGLYTEGPDELILNQAIPVTYSEAHTEVPAAIGLPCPALVFPNLDDHDYVQVTLDDAFSRTPANLAKVHDPLLRMMLWTSLWDMARDATLDMTTYADLLLNAAADEPDLGVLRDLLSQVQADIFNNPRVQDYLPPTCGPRQPGREYRLRFEALAGTQLLAAPPGSDRQKLWFDSYVRLATSAKAQANLLSYLQDPHSLPDGLIIDQDHRWDILAQLSGQGYSQVAALLLLEKARDPSNAGHLSALRVEVVQPKPEVKEAWFARIADTASTYTVAEIQSAVLNLFPWDQRDLQQAFAGRFYDLLTAPALAADPLRQGLFSLLVPLDCTSENANKLSDYLLTQRLLDPSIRRRLTARLIGDQRCIRVRDHGR